MAGIFWNGFTAFVCLFLGALQVVSGADKSTRSQPDAPRCKPYLTTQTVSVGTSNLYEIHLRHNIKGKVTVQRGTHTTREVKVYIKKSVITREKASGFIINQTKVGTAKGEVFVLQLDYEEPSSKVVKVVIGGIITAITLLILFAIAIWCWVSRRRHQEFQLVRNNRSSAERRGPPEANTFPDEAQETDVKTCNLNRLPPHPRGTPVLLPPPPARAPVEANHSPSKPRSTPAGIAGTVGSPRTSFPKSSMVALAVVTVLSVVYAACVIEPKLYVEIRVPDGTNIRGGIKLFLKSGLQIPVDTSSWPQWNETDSRIFDIADASVTQEPPCFADDVCRSKYNGALHQDLAGCDPVSRACLCPRGFQMQEGVCLDKDECATGEANCAPGATCRNLHGTYSCQCHKNSYMTTEGCHDCQDPCGPGYYEAVACTQTTNRVCKACTACTGATYESGTCDGTSNSHCIHVAHPLVYNDKEPDPVWREAALHKKKLNHKKRKRMKVETSDNVFLEDLHNTPSLDANWYITNTRQAYDTFWERESGLKINFGLYDVELLPQFEGVDHESDNEFIMNRPKNDPLKEKIRTIREKFCRHPIPDYYKLTLDIYRDRITKAKTIICDSKDPNKSKCPITYRDGDEYTVRTLNDGCTEMMKGKQTYAKGTYPKKLDVNYNSIVCTEHTALLTSIFNQSFTQEKPYSFPPKFCKNKQENCGRCLREKKCKNPESFLDSCCRIDCYAKDHCKTAFSDTCTKVPVECAMGDAYRFTLQPAFDNLMKDNAFQCHIRYKRSDILYKLFYFITIPSTDKRASFSTSKVEKTVRSGDLNFQSRGEHQQEYITVTHNSNINMKKQDFILMFRPDKRAPRDPDIRNLTLYTMKDPDEFSKSKLKLTKVLNNIYVTSIQFDQPFAYSTATWQSAGHWCDKDVSHFRPAQKLFFEDGQNVDEVRPTSEIGKQYYLRAQNNPPHFKMHVPGNASVLSWYFQGNGPELVLNGSLQTKLELSPGGGVWTITITGEMSGCPGYLAVTINDRSTQEELFRYDLLITCPATFRLSCKVPNLVFDREHVFEVLLKDSHKEHTVYISQLEIDKQRHLPEPEASTAHEVAEFTGWSVIMVIMVTTGVVLWILFFWFVYLEVTKSGQVKAKETSSDLHTSFNESSTGGRCYANGQITKGQFIFVVAYAIFRVVYSFLFTFTVFLAVLLLVLRPDFTQISKLPEYQQQQYNATRGIAADIDTYRNNETLRQIRLATNMQGACNKYIQNSFKLMQSEMYNITWRNQLEMYAKTTSISAEITSLVNTQLQVYRDKISNYTAEYEERFSKTTTPAFMRYKQFINAVYQNGWLGFPRFLYNQSKTAQHRQKAFTKSRFLSGIETNFLSFIGVEEVDRVQLMALKFWKRFAATMPDVEELRFPKLNPDAPLCSFSREEAFEKIKSNEHEEKLAMFRFYPMDPDSSLSRRHVREESNHYSYILPVEEEDAHKAFLFSVDDFVEAINTHVFQYVFLILDTILLIYRCTRTYSTIITLCRGFEEVVSVNETKMTEEQKQADLLNKSNDSMRSMTPSGEDRTRGSKNILTDSPSVNHSPKVTTKPLTVQNPLSTSPSLSQHRHFAAGSLTSRGEVLLSLLARLFLTKVLSKLLIGCIVGLLCYVVVTLTCHLVTTDLVYHYGGFSTFLAGLDVRLNHTNSFLTKQAQHLNQVTMEIYKQQMVSELHSLQTMMEHFNLEQEDIVSYYRSEVCTIRSKLLADVAECNVTVNPSKIALQLLPCNFIPITASSFTGYNKYRYIASLKSEFLPFVEAARNIVFKLLYASLSTLAIILLIHISSCVLFHFLKTRHKFVVHQVYLSTLPPPGFIPGHRFSEETDGDSDDGFQGPPVRLQASPLRTTSSCSTGKPAPETLTPDTGYSETKV